MTTQLPFGGMDCTLFPTVSAEIARSLCLGAGDWSRLAAREVERVLTDERRRRPEAFVAGLEDLVARGAITAADSEILRRVVACVFDAVRDKADPVACRREILDLYGRLCADRAASPAAIAIASVALQATEPTVGDPAKGVARAAAISAGGTAAAGLGGALLGAGLGFGFGGPIGAGIGAAIGGAVGAGTAVSNQLGI
ncbi:MAG: hypothetical protein U1E34_08845 [Amaricoccus sp.]